MSDIELSAIFTLVTAPPAILDSVTAPLLISTEDISAVVRSLEHVHDPEEYLRISPSEQLSVRPSSFPSQWKVVDLIGTLLA